jgi:hypothetical protein
VDGGWEWHPAITGFRGSIEQRWLAALQELAGGGGAMPAGDVPGALRALTGRGGGPDLAGYLARKASREQFAEFAASPLHVAGCQDHGGDPRGESVSSYLELDFKHGIQERSAPHHHLRGNERNPADDHRPRHHRAGRPIALTCGLGGEQTRTSSTSGSAHGER